MSSLRPTPIHPASADQQALIALFVRSPAAVCLFQGPEQVAGFVNDRYQALFGQRPLLHRPLAEAQPELARHGIAAVIRAIQAGGADSAAEAFSLTLERGTPQAVVWDWSAHALRDEHGRVEGVLLQVCEREARTQEIRPDALPFRSLAEASPDLIGFYTLQGRPLYLNSAGRRLLGVDSLEALRDDHDPLDCFTLEEGRRQPEVVAEAVRTGLWEGEARMRNLRTGREWPAWRTLFCIRNGRGQPAYLATMVRDLTEEKRTQEHQRLLAEAGRLLADALSVEQAAERVAHLMVPAFADICLVNLVRPNGRLVTLGCAGQDPAGEAWLAGLRGTDTETASAPFGHSDVLRTGQSQLLPRLSDTLLERIRQTQPALAAALAELKPVSLLACPMRVGGRVLGTITFLTTEASGRAYAPQDVALADQISYRCGLAMENARLFQQAQEAIQLRDEFLSIASHELKTPLTPLHLHLSMLLRQLPQRIDDADTRQWLADKIQAVLRQGQRLNRLVDELLDISRIARGQLQLELESVDLAAVVREVASGFAAQGMVERAGCRLRLELEESLVGQWDRLRLEQVVTNLLSNALRYGEGGEVSIQARAEADQVSLRVRDQGMGIAPEEQERIFERFERGASGRQHDGLGLGLYIVRQVVERMGGSIGLESAPGAGACFQVRLPRRPAAGREA